jgi:formiminotetrahydrofolate cyclodeaminase
MKLSERPLAELLHDFRAPSPTPGGGSASALTGAVGASLLAMVASMAKHRAATEEDVVRRAGEIAERLTALVDLDSEAYESVVAAYKLPKASAGENAERSERIQQALTMATEVPLEAMRRCSEAIEVAPVVAAFGNPNAASDVGVALELLLAGARGAKLNVDVNLTSLKDADRAERVRTEASTLEQESEAGGLAARARLADGTNG